MHFYTQTAEGVAPRHFVEMSTRPGQLRPSRMSDAKAAAKRGEIWVPSVTSIMAVLDKPALVNWKVDMHLQQAYNIAYRWGQSWDDPAQWIAEVKRLTELEMDKAPSAGTDIHKELEAWYTGGIVSDGAKQICENVAAKIAQVTGIDQWHSERNFVHPMGFGGQVDLHNVQWVIDFKSKPRPTSSSRARWPMTSIGFSCRPTVSDWICPLHVALTCLSLWKMDRWISTSIRKLNWTRVGGCSSTPCPFGRYRMGV